MTRQKHPTAEDQQRWLTEQATRMTAFTDDEPQHSLIGISGQRQVYWRPGVQPHDLHPCRAAGYTSLSDGSSC